MSMVFEDLEAWQAARMTVMNVYRLTRTGELTRDFGLKDQLQRASVSVMTNIAEGFERSGSAEKLHFYNIAKASSGEVRSLLYVVEDNFHMEENVLQIIREHNAEASAKLSGLISSYRKRQAFTTISFLLFLASVIALFPSLI